MDPFLGATVVCLLGLAVDGGSPSNDPIERLADDVRTFVDEAGGDYDERSSEVTFDLERDDEIGRLSSAIDDMAALVRVYQQRDRELRGRVQQLERRSAFTDDVLDAIDDVFFVLDEDGELREWNQTLVEVSGYSNEEIERMDGPKYFDDADLDSIEASIEEAFETGDTHIETQIVSKDGDRTPYEFVASVVADPDGDPVEVGVGRDVSDRDRYERELERTTHLLEQAQQLTNVGAWELVVEGDGYELQWTDEVARIFGLGPETAASISLEEALAFYHPADRSRLRTAIDRAVEEGEPYDLELRVITADGDRRWVRAIGDPVVGGERWYDSEAAAGDREVVAVRGSIQDVTDRTERERELERTRAFLEHIQRIAGVGGWEVDAETEPSTVRWTDELYRLHDLPLDVTPDLETAIESYHPEDRSRVRREVENALETESSYDLEARLRTQSGDVRWVRTFGAPVFDDGRLVGYRGAVQDISDLKRREIALESLHDVARRLLGIDTVESATELVVEAADEIVEEGGAALYRLDPEVNRLEPAASDGFVDCCGGARAIPVGAVDSPLWNAFATGGQTVVDDPSSGDRPTPFGDAVESALVVPVGDHGVFTVASTASSIALQDRQLIETLVATTEAAFDRLESEQRLLERDEELAARNRRLRRQIAINGIIRRINRSLVGAESRAEIERTVPERLLEVDDVAFAWIGSVDADGSFEPRTWAGTDEEYLDDVALDPSTAAEPAARTARSAEPTVVSNVVDDLQAETWRTRAFAAGFQSIISVPLSLEEYTHGVLTVYADEPDVFTDLERTVFAELGESIANAVEAVRTREAFHAETGVELTLEFEAPDDVLSRIASATTARVEYRGLGTHAGDESRLFFGVSGAEPADVSAALEALVSVADYRLISRSDDECLFEATVSGEVLASRLVRFGANPRAVRADGERIVVTVDVPTGADVREFVAMVRSHYDRVDLRGRRDVERAVHTRGELVASLFDELTDRQLEVLRTAYFAGFFEWPRESTGEEVAEMLDVSQPTINRHLRTGQERLLSQLFDDEPPAPVFE
ncbi:bacterio-opsin activator domain-containing protein [Natrarchaeobius sp. A-rgal3]